MERADRYERGAAGEREVAARLEGLPVGFHVLHDLDVPGSKANIDHLVIGRSGVVAVDAKAYSGRFTAGGGTLWRGRFPIRKECATARWEAGRLSDHLGVPVQPVLCVVGAELPAPVNATDEAVVCDLDGVMDFVLESPAVLDEAQIADIAARASRLVRHRTSSPVAAAAAPPKRRSGPRRTDRRQGRSAVLLRLVAAVVLILFAAPIARVLSNALTPAVQRASSGVAERAAPALDGLPDAAPGPSALAVPTTTETTAPATPLGVDAPPTVAFECAGPTGGWTAAMVATQYVQDPDGYHTWYRIGGEENPWMYVGKFRSGLDAPPAWSGIAPSSSVEIRYDRVMLLDPETSAGYEPFTTGPDC